jgi:hypothetical protein
LASNHRGTPTRHQVEAINSMMSIPNQLSPLLSTVPAWALLLSMLVVSLILIFAGRTVVKVLAFLVVGLIGASIGGVLAAQYLAGAGSLGTLLGVLLGFVVGGLVGVLLIAVGIGLAIGYAAYVLTAGLVSGTTIPLIVGFVFFIIGLALYDRVLSLITALAGGLLLFDVLELYGFDPALAVIVAGAAALAGIWVQEGLGKHRNAQPTIPSAGGQPSAHT